MLTEIYLCHDCSCQEILRTETAGQVGETLENKKLLDVAIPKGLWRSLKEAGVLRGDVSRPFPSWNRSILTEISLCHACSCQEILRTETAGQAPTPGDTQGRL
jgi:hypothetical protein|eukprot:SAG25_NODE_1277_length_3422_cov_1.618718_5_plen_103_part_00